MRVLSVAFAFISCICMAGCLPDKTWQPVPSSAVLPPPIQSETDGLRYKDDPSDLVFPHDRNHATIEFVESGELADPLCGSLPANPRCQRNYAVAFIQQGRIEAFQRHKQLTVLTFIHGNENNAREQQDNYPHFRQLIDCLNLGEGDYQSKYSQYFKDKTGKPLKKAVDNVLTCRGFDKPGPRLYLGVFIGWRGKRTSTPANLRQAPAMRISRNQRVSETLYMLRDAAKHVLSYAPQGGISVPVDPSRLVVLGHSFGGLLLEQVAKQIYTKAFHDPTTAKQIACEVPASQQSGLAPFTDLIVLINPAINGKPAQEFITLFKSTDATLQGVAFCPASQLAGALVRPYLLNIVSKTDFWSIRAKWYLLPRGSALRHTFGAETKWGKPEDIRYWKDDEYEAKPSLFTRKHATPANILAFQNLCYVSKDFTTGDANVCDYLHDERFGGSPQIARRVGLAMPGTVPDPQPSSNEDEEQRKTHNPWNSLYVRYNCKPRGVNLKDDPRVTCGAAPGSIRSDLHIWNDTPYWLAAIDGDVIDGHNDFWNASFLKLVLDLEDSFPVLKANDVIPTPMP